MNRNVLAKNGFVLFWNLTDSKFIAELHVKTKGWVSFGFSPNGEASGSDVFVGWISNNQAFYNVQARVK